MVYSLFMLHVGVPPLLIIYSRLSLRCEVFVSLSVRVLFALSFKSLANQSWASSDIRHHLEYTYEA